MTVEDGDLHTPDLAIIGTPARRDPLRRDAARPRDPEPGPGSRARRAGAGRAPPRPDRGRSRRWRGWCCGCWPAARSSPRRRAAQPSARSCAERDQQPDAEAGRALADVLAPDVPRRAGDVEVHPRLGVDELLQERRRVDRARLALLRCVDEVGDRASWSAPCTRRGAAAATPARPSLAGRGDALGPGVVVGDQRRRRSSPAPSAPRPSASPGRRCGRRPARAHQLSASARISRPSASVLMISTVRPLCWVMMSPGLSAWPLGMFSVDGDDGEHVDGEPELGDRGHGLDHGRAAGHVHLHLVHPRRGLDRDPARVEGHRLADEPQRRRPPPPPGVAQDDQPRLLVAAAARPRSGRPSRAPRPRRGPSRRP